MTATAVEGAAGVQDDSRPWVVDLFAGRGGWTKGLAAAGFQVVGVDLLPQPDYPVGPGVHFLQADIRSLRAHELRLTDLPFAVVASPPCQPFSTVRPSRTEPPVAEGYELVAHTLRVIAELRPTFWAIENVRGAWKWWKPTMGDPDFKDNPYYLWGNLPDAMREQGPYRSKLKYRDPGKRSEIPQSLADELGRVWMQEFQRMRAGAQSEPCEMAHERQVEASDVRHLEEFDQEVASTAVAVGALRNGRRSL